MTLTHAGMYQAHRIMSERRKVIDTVVSVCNLCRWIDKDIICIVNINMHLNACYYHMSLEKCFFSGSLKSTVAVPIRHITQQTNRKNKIQGKTNHLAGVYTKGATTHKLLFVSGQDQDVRDFHSHFAGSPKECLFGRIQAAGISTRALSQNVSPIDPSRTETVI